MVVVLPGTGLVVDVLSRVTVTELAVVTVVVTISTKNLVVVVVSVVGGPM
jgi:hypothetical protein